jgi:hypothetical protein
MFERFGRSVELAKASLGVLRADKELLLFPLVSFVALVVVVISFAVPFVLVGGLTDAAERQLTPAMVVLGFLFHVVTYTVIFFFNTALVGAARGDAGPMFRPETMAGAFRSKSGLSGATLRPG